MLKQVGIVKNNTKSLDVFTQHISDNFLKIEKMRSSEYVKYCWEKYKAFDEIYKQDRAMNGNIFELIISSELYRQSISPMFLQAKVAFVPNVSFDILLYSSNRVPIGISLKTSLRERYKQADLEATALKYVHRRAKNYLITLDKKDSVITKDKIDNGILLGLDDIIVADTEEFDIFVENLSKTKFIQPDKIDIITAQNIVSQCSVTPQGKPCTPLASHARTDAERRGIKPELSIK
ncbi:MAG: hypothetical protein FWF76_04395 [Oscillospiraceae bacterium]|nr:hypothetical protein [Oscillospiraceae bacterium]